MMIRKSPPGKYYLSEWTNTGIQGRKVETIFIHPKYNPQTFSNDIAVLKMAKPAEFTAFVRPVCMWEGSDNLEYVVNRYGKKIIFI